MSKLNRKLLRSILEIEGKKVSWWFVFREKLDDLISVIQRHLLYHEIRWFFRNLPNALKDAWYFRDFDDHYAIEMFARHLDRLAYGLKRYNNHSDALKQYRRCKYAAYLLRQAYDGIYAIKDVSYLRWSNNNEIYFDKTDNRDYCGMYQMKYKRKYSEEYSEKMWKIINKRIAKVEKDRKEFVWKYIHKHIELWWD